MQEQMPAGRIQEQMFVGRIQEQMFVGKGTPALRLPKPHFREPSGNYRVVQAVCEPHRLIRSNQFSDSWRLAVQKLLIHLVSGLHTALGRRLQTL
jgi:hypothetical protein